MLAAILAVYSQVRSHDFINYDDPVYVTNNTHVRDGLTANGVIWAFTSFEYSNWFPLTWLSHMLDCEMFGLDSGLHHLTNVVLHALTALALFALLRRMTIRIPAARWPSAFVAFAFGLHPLHVESVAWIAERKDVLSALFWILTMWAYAWYSEAPSSGKYMAVVGLFFCGLMSKPMVVTLPFLMLLLDYWPLRRNLDRRLILEKIPLFALSAVASAIAYVAQKRSGAVAAFGQIALPLRLENALVTYVVYIAKFIWPTNLAVFYPYAERYAAWQWLGAAAILAAITYFVLRVRNTRPYLAIGWLWYLGTLVPVIGLVQIGSQARADRYTYLPMIGISIMLAWLIADTVKSDRIVIVVSAVVCFTWCGLTWSYVGDWQNSETLFRHAIQVTDRNWVMYNNLGGTLRREGRLKEAILDFENAATIRPNFADVQDNLGEALSVDGQADAAVPHLMDALRLQPGFAKAHVDLGAALLTQGRTQEAAAQFQNALSLDPANSEAHFRYGGILASQGSLADAMPHFQAALPYLTETVRNNPKDPDGHHNLGGVLGMMGRMDEAIAEFSQTAQLRPRDPEAHYDLGLALAGRQNLTGAAGEFAKAISLNPDYAMAHFNLARVLAALGRNVEAEREYNQALLLAPDFEPAKRGLDSLRH